MDVEPRLYFEFTARHASNRSTTQSYCRTSRSLSEAMPTRSAAVSGTSSDPSSSVADPPATDRLPAVAVTGTALAGQRRLPVPVRMRR